MRIRTFSEYHVSDELSHDEAIQLVKQADNGYETLAKYQGSGTMRLSPEGWYDCESD